MTVQKIRGATAAVAALNNVVLANRELGLETDTLQLKVGDGITPWNGLPYLPGSGGTVESVNGIVPDLTGDVQLNFLPVGTIGATVETGYNNSQVFTTVDPEGMLFSGKMAGDAFARVSLFADPNIGGIQFSDGTVDMYEGPGIFMINNSMLSVNGSWRVTGDSDVIGHVRFVESGSVAAGIGDPDQNTGGASWAYLRGYTTAQLVAFSTTGAWAAGAVGHTVLAYDTTLNALVRWNHATDTWVAIGGGGGSDGVGLGANWVAASNAPADQIAAVTAAGGRIADGTADNVEIAAALAEFSSVRLTEGTFNVAAEIVIPKGKSLQGEGYSTKLVGSTGMTGTAFISTTQDHCRVADLSISGGTATAKNGVYANIASSAGFDTGGDACLVLDNIVMRNIPGVGVWMQGAFNKDSKISKVHVWNATGDGFYIQCPDGSMTQCIAGTCGGYGFNFNSNSASWRANNCKAWFADLDGWLIDGVRHSFSNIEGQDCAKAGVRIIGNLLSVNGVTADSNSYDGVLNDNVFSGIEIGLDAAGASSGGFDITVVGGQAWDKNEGARGYKQRSGVRLRSGIRRLMLLGINTGNSAGTHKNVTDGIEWNTASDATHTSNVAWNISLGTAEHSIPDATTALLGLARLATNAEAQSMASTSLVVTPRGVAEAMISPLARQAPFHVNGCTVENFSVFCCSTSTALPAINGNTYYFKMFTPTPITVSNIVIRTLAGGASLTANRNWVALYDSSKAKLAQSADLTTPWATAGLLVNALTAPQAIAAGTFWIAVHSEGTTKFAPIRAPQTGMDWGGALPNPMFGIVNDGSTATAPANIGTQAYQTNPYWIGVS